MTPSSKIAASPTTAFSTCRSSGLTSCFAMRAVLVRLDVRSAVQSATAYASVGDHLDRWG